MILSGCASIDPEERSYPPGWPAPFAAPDAGCAPPEGTFENIHTLAHHRYPDEPSYALGPPALNVILGTVSLKADVTHVRLHQLDNGNLEIKAFGVQDGQETLLVENELNADTGHCQDHRWFIATTTDHEGFDGYRQEDYDPLYTAMYLVGTLGIGAPISGWWNYVLMTTEDGSLILRRQRMRSALLFIMVYSRLLEADDWFLYPATDAKSMIERASMQPTDQATQAQQ